MSYKLLKESRIKIDQINTQSTEQSELLKSTLRKDSVIKNFELDISKLKKPLDLYIFTDDSIKHLRKKKVSILQKLFLK